MPKLPQPFLKHRSLIIDQRHYLPIETRSLYRQCWKEVRAIAGLPMIDIIALIEFRGLGPTAGIA